MFSQRIKIINISIYLSFAVLLMVLFYMQVVRFSYYRNLSLKNMIRIIPVEGCRGRILDRNRVPIATNEIRFDLAVIPQEIKDVKETLKRLSKITGRPVEELTKNYKNNYYLPFIPVRVVPNIEQERAFFIEEKLSGVPGAIIWTNSQRLYPYKSNGAHILGYLGMIEQQEYTNLRDYGYKIRDLVGKSGIERQYDAYLKGESGGIQVEVDSKSREVRRLGVREPHKGKDLQLTIDIWLQIFIDKLFEGKSGGCIVMRSDTGQVLALTSSPEFDPNIFISGDNRDKSRLLNDRRRPLINRAISAAYPPGSTFKIIIAAAGLASKVIDTNTTFVCNGSYKFGNIIFGCWKSEGHDSQDVDQALTHSCNVFFYNLGHALGVDNIYYYASLFGLGSLTGIDLPGEKAGLLPNPAWKRSLLKEGWYEGDTINYSIGQGYLLATPIQMLKAATIIANEGHCPQPYLVEEIDGKRMAGQAPHVARIDKAPLRSVRLGMRNVVNSPTGTGQYARLPDMEIAAKTGTAQPGTSGDTHAWLVGFLPYERPKISFVIFLEHGGQGGGEPANMARLIGIYLQNNGFLSDGGDLVKE